MVPWCSWDSRPRPAPPPGYARHRPWPRCPGTCISGTGSTAAAARKNSTSCLSCRWRGSRWHTSTPEIPRGGEEGDCKAPGEGQSGAGGEQGGREGGGRWYGPKHPPPPTPSSKREQAGCRLRLDAGALGMAPGVRVQPKALLTQWGAPGRTKFTYPFLGGFPSKVLIHVPV